MRTFPFRSSPASEATGSSPSSGARTALWWIISLGFGLAVLLGGAWLALSVTPPGMQLALADGATELALDTVIPVQLEGWAPELRSAALFEAPAGAPARAERALPVQVEITRAGIMPGESEALVRPSQPLRPDSTYRLSLTGQAIGVAPFLQANHYVKEVRFSTPASPRPQPRNEAVALRWNEPLEIAWGLPVRDVQVQVSPPAAARSWVDAGNPLKSYVAIEQPADGTTYEITVVDALAHNGMRLQQPQAYRVSTPVRPAPLASQALPAFIGRPLPVRWNVPVDQVKLAGPEALAIDWKPDAQDPAVVQLQLEGLAQGETYEITVEDAIAKTGAPLAAPATLAVVTAPPLAAPSFKTGFSGLRVPIDVEPTLTFDAPIMNLQDVEAAIAIEPAVAGHFEWLSDRSVKFVADGGFPYETDVRFTVHAGPAGPRAADGGYLEQDATFKFTTMTNKVIEVDLTRQVMHLWEGDQKVRSITVGTGVRGAETPTGEYFVQYKMPVARFRGTNPSGSTYDIPDVKWVLAFWEDYTIHGAYWRSNFGVPASNGCVSMTDANAKIVFDWAPVGTLIQIHY